MNEAANTPIQENAHVKEFMSMLRENNKDTTDFAALLGYARLAANAAIQKNIVTYSKTRNTYIEYRKAGLLEKVQGGA